MAFRRALKRTALVGGGAVATAFGLSQLIEYRKTQARLAHVAAEAELKVPFVDELPSRQAQLAALTNTEEFDVLVVGGGATGAGCALDAVTRNLKTALVERSDFSSGTSSRSTKLIHGGVRYLQKAIMKLDYEQYMMVKEALHERANLLEIAPHLSAPLPIMLPVYKWWQLPYYWAGIKMYDLVAGIQCLKSSYVLSKTKALELFPMLKKDKLVGAIVYYDGQHNDARMNLAIALSAARYGAAIANYTEVIHLLKKKDPQSGREKVCGARCRDVITGQEFDVRAKCVINATGPFTDALRKMDNQEASNICQPSAGVHIVIPGYYSPDNMGLLDPATSDGRVIFFLPWENMTIAGTTDTPTSVTAHPIPGEDDINFILTEVRNYLSPDVEVRRGDVLAAWSGIRPLVTDPSSKDTQSICRNHIVSISDSGLVTIAGELAFICLVIFNDSDQHDACPVCLGIAHAGRALTEPKPVRFVASSGRPWKDGWADHMEYVDGLADDERNHAGALDGLQPGLKPASAPQEDDDVLDIGLDIHGLSEDEQESSLSAQCAAAAALVGHDDASLFSLFRRAAEKLQVDWPLLRQLRSRRAGEDLSGSGGTARAMSSVTMLQTYQAMCLAELGSLVPDDSPLAPLLNEVRVATDYILRTELYIWDAPVSVAGLFGHSLEAIQARFDLRKKQAEALRDIIPRRQPKPKPAASSHRPAAPLPTGKRPRPLLKWVRRQREHILRPELHASRPGAQTHWGDNAPPTVLQVSRLAAHFPQWRACAPSPWVLRTVAMGYRLQFRVNPPRFQGVVNTTVNTEAAMILREEIKALLQKRAYEWSPPETDKGCVHFLSLRATHVPGHLNLGPDLLSGGPLVAQHLASTYGGRAFDVAKMAQVTGQRWPIVGKRLVSEFPYIESEVLYAIKEYACTAIDVIARRTRLGFLNVQAADEALPRIVQIMGKELDWSQEKRTEELEAARKFLYHEMGYRSRSEQITKTSEINLDNHEVARYKKRFHKFDKESKGFITTVDVQRVLQSINVYIDENALHEILNEVDLNKNGQVEIDEFLQLMSAVKKGHVSDSRLAILMKTAEETLDQREPVSVDRSGGGV
ncbi:glycerol-3-phosphate dehydrogenase, mitochondrial [Oreochromis aureus]|uniref:glycerol-3-phosphate dehydrogenase, mitochondrial n=1 Tax=Oreochromis aureus TaxID=47969 RepID=UPI001953F428|nr:glycerol-3-phosphate dehydrogenase, mitochondrial [Oreochromis aureus]